MDKMVNNLIDGFFISEEELIEYIKFCIKEEKLEDIINNVTIGYQKSSYYDSINLALNINIKDILIKKQGIDKWIRTTDSLINFFQRRTGIINNVNLINMYNIQSINHELRHAYQNKLDFSNIDDWYTALIKKDLILMYMDENFFNNFFYEQFHDFFFSEYDANIYGYIKTLNFLNSIKSSKLYSDITLLNKIIAQNIIDLYKDMDNKRKLSYPSKNMLKLYKYIKIFLIDHNEKFDINQDFSKLRSIEKPKEEFERLKLGLSLKKETLEYIYDLSTSKKKTLNLFEDIKSIRK